MSMEVASRLRVLLADDHPVVLAGVRALLVADGGLDIVGEARDGDQVLQLAAVLSPDVAVIDVSMPGSSGGDITRRLTARCPACKVLVLTVHEDRAYVRQLLDAGASGYLLKRSAAEELCRAVHAVAAGGTYVDPVVAGSLLASRSRASAAAPAAGSGAMDLSEREVEVLRLTATGHSHKAIAATLDIGLKTVETYKARAMSKLGFRSRVEVIRFALSEGWMDAPTTAAARGGGPV